MSQPLVFQDDPHFWFETLRVFAADEYGGGLFGEVLAIASRIKAGDYGSWFEAWSAAADTVAKEADDRLARGHKVSARDGYLRASNYYRSSEFFLHGNPRDPRIARVYRRSVDCYKACAALFDPPIEPVGIPMKARRCRSTLPSRRPLLEPARPSSCTADLRLGGRDAFRRRARGDRARLERARL